MFFWKQLCNSIEKNILICDAAFHLHNFLVDYRNTLDDGELDNAFDRSIFVDDMCDNNIFNIVVSNDNNRPSGRPTNVERERRINGVVLRDMLRDKLQNHNMHRLRKDDDGEWTYDRSHHIDIINI